MLNSEQASAKRETFKIKDWHRTRSAAAAKLSERTHAWVRFLGDDDSGEIRSRIREQAQEFSASRLPDKERQELLAALFPRLDGTLEQTWKRVPSMPLMHMWRSRPVRAPGNLRFVAANRDRWLNHVCTDLKRYDPDVEWLAAWAGHLGYGGAHRSTALLLATAINTGGPVGARVFEILRQSGNGEHEVGIPGRHVTTAFLNSSSEEAWDYIERMLFAAQRQEGLRQSILESIDIAHPEAFKRMLRLILDKDLVRFASTVRAVDVWFGFLWDSMSTKHAESIIERVLSYLESPADRAIARAGKDPESAYLALWCDAYEDADAAVPLAVELLDSRRAEQRFVGLHGLHWAGLAAGIAPATRLLDDPELAVAAKALDALEGVSNAAGSLGGMTGVDEDGLGRGGAGIPLEPLERLLTRIQKSEAKFKPLVFPWGRTTLKAAEVGRAIVTYCKYENAERLIAILDRLDPYSRANAASMLVGLANAYDDPARNFKPKFRSPAARAALVSMLGDPAKDVRKTAGDWLAKLPFLDDEAAQHEALLSRSASDIRTRAIDRLAALPDDKLLAVTERLLASSAPEALAAAEILRQMTAKERAPDRARELARAFQSRLKKPPGKDLQAALDAILNVDPHAKWTLENALGLLPDGWKHSRPIPKLRDIPQETVTKQTVDLLKSLEAFIERHMDVDVRKVRPGEDDPWKSQSGLLGGAWIHGLDPSERHSREDDLMYCPVAELLDEWQRSTGPVASDPAELLRAWIAQDSTHRNWESNTHSWTKDLVALGLPKLTRFGAAIELFLEWALRRADQRPAELLLDQLEGAIARNDLFRKKGDEDHDRLPRVFDVSAKKVLERYRACPAAYCGRYQPDRLRRLLALCDAAAAAFVPYIDPRRSGRYDDESVYVCPVELDLDWLVALWELGELNEHDLIRRLIVPPESEFDEPRHSELNHLMERRAGRNARWQHRPVPPAIDPVLDRIRRRALEIELPRGDAPTAASSVIYALHPTGGLDAVIPALASFGKLKLIRGYNWSNTSKAASFSKILSESRPGKDDTPGAFAAAAKNSEIPEHRLIELALFAPQWAAHVEHALGWPGLESGALWLRAHTKDRSNEYVNEDEKPEPWEVRVSELTPISADSRKDGAVDRAWFDRCSKQLGPKRWAALYDAAKYASSGAGHKRAQLFADVMQGKASEKSLTSAITTKRHQDSIRALGLLAVKPSDAGKKQVLSRYKVMQEIRRTSRKHGGSMLQASEKRAVEIGMENLAWTAGYPDPLRLQWAMEIEELGKLADGPVSVKVGDITVTLAVDDDGTPSLTASKKGKELKSVPPAIKKDKKVAPLAEQVTALKRQGSRVRQALEQAMCRGDEFSAAEVAGLWKHPILRSAMSRLILAGTTKSGGSLLGYPDKNGKALRAVDGTHEPLRATDSLRIAHPLDLLPANSWSQWQHECFAAERIQPFKQVFREIYVPLASEKTEARTARYAGQQVQPRQALALFGTRGWVARAEEGVQRTFHHEGITARVEFEEGFFTPAEIDGLTLAGVSFAKRGSYKDLPIKDVPPRLFSEVMRDMDLVVSVAHRGGVDPEASHSTVEMRAALLRETCELLSLGNVRLDGNRALIKGTHGDYALHLGSGTIHRLPGGTVWVVPVHSQHRGRIFLPFADNDPKTAEVMSKALLLARDQEIRDPSILEQIR